MYNKLFPNLAKEGYSIKSPNTPDYNCIAWAVGDDKKWWWPDVQRQYFWPLHLERKETLDSFIKCFNFLGYKKCKSRQYQVGYRKIAIYANDSGMPMHAARQLPSGKWTSKLGPGHDIEHSLEGLENKVYGKVSQIFKIKVSKR